MKKIAFFDFDGTITKKDTLLEFIKFTHGRRLFAAGFFINAPYLLAYKAGLISNQRAKEKVLTYFYLGTHAIQFQRWCADFAAKQLPFLLRPKALVRLNQHIEEGAEVVIVSASPGGWIKPWADLLGIALVASEVEVQQGVLTGRLFGKNCHGKEKVRRIENAYDLSRFDTIVAYGDTPGDRPMLSLASEAYYKPFRR